MSATKPSTPPTRLRRGETFEGEIETLAYGGRGIARPDGYVVFVNGGLPGDTVRAEITKSKRGYAEANAIELLSPSSDRLPETDVHQGEPCPGASWQALDYGRQLAYKEEHVADVFAWPLWLSMAGFGLLFLTLVLFRTRTEIRARRLRALEARERMA